MEQHKHNQDDLSFIAIRANEKMLVIRLPQSGEEPDSERCSPINLSIVGEKSANTEDPEIALTRLNISVQEETRFHMSILSFLHTLG